MKKLDIFLQDARILAVKELDGLDDKKQAIYLLKMFRGMMTGEYSFNAAESNGNN